MVKRSRQHAHDYGIFLGRLIQARVEAGMTQTAVAKKLGKPRSFVSKCEQGERRVDIVEARAFARIYNKDVAYFCE